MNHDQKQSLWLSPLGDTRYLLQERIRKLSKKYETPVFEPHVTLLGGLTMGETELIQLTDTLAGGLRPFDIVLTTAGYTDTFYQSLFIYAAESEGLLRARKTAEQMFGIRPDGPYIPHLSLMYGALERNEKERILNVMGRQFHVRFTVHNIMLVNTSGEPKDWKNIHSSEFGK